MTDFVAKPKAITDPELGRSLFLLSVQAANEERDALETVIRFLRAFGYSLGGVLVSRSVQWEGWTTIYLYGAPVHRQRWVSVGETGLQLVQEWIAGFPVEPDRRIVVGEFVRHPERDPERDPKPDPELARRAARLAKPPKRRGVTPREKAIAAAFTKRVSELEAGEAKAWRHQARDYARAMELENRLVEVCEIVGVDPGESFDDLKERLRELVRIEAAWLELGKGDEPCS